MGKVVGGGCWSKRGRVADEPGRENGEVGWKEMVPVSRPRVPCELIGLKVSVSVSTFA